LEIYSYGEQVLYFIISGALVQIFLKTIQEGEALLFFLVLTGIWVFIFEPIKSIFSLLWYEKEFLTDETMENNEALDKHKEYHLVIIDLISSISTFLMYSDFSLATTLLTLYWSSYNYSGYDTIVFGIGLFITIVHIKAKIRKLA
jgi:hypothetical protein